MEYRISNLSAGELSTKLTGRIDLPYYQHGCKTLENMFIMPEGGVTKRPGTCYVGNVKDDSKQVRLIPFLVSGSVGIICEFGDTYVRFYKAGAQIEDGGSPVEETTPWGEADLPDLRYAQWPDGTMYLVHPDYEVRKLVRTSDISWTLSTVSFTGHNTNFFYDIDTVDTANDIIKLKDADGNYVTNSDLNDGQAVEFSTSDTLPAPLAVNTTYWLAWDAGNSGWTIHTSRAAAEAGTGDIDLTDTGTGDHLAELIEEFYFTNHRPGLIAIHESRLLLGGCTYKPERVWGSRIAFPEDFSQTASSGNDYLPESAWQQDVFTSRRDKVTWLASESNLLAGSENGVWLLYNPDPQTTFFESPWIPLRQSGVGAKQVDPVLYGGAVMFVQRGGKVVRSAFYMDAEQKYVAQNASLLASHLAEEGICALDMMNTGDPMLLALRDDGVLLTASQRSDVIGWARHGFSGAVESIAVIPNGADDQLWMVVNRTIDGATERHVEYMVADDWVEADDCWFVDAAVEYDNGAAEALSGITADSPAQATLAATTSFANDDLVELVGSEDWGDLNGTVWMLKNKAGDTFDLYYLDGTTPYDTSARDACTDGSLIKVQETLDGLDHLEGEEVAVLADGVDIGTYTVASGEIGLGRYVNHAIVGLLFLPVIELMPFIGKFAVQEAIPEVYIALHRTLGLKVGSTSENTYGVVFREGSFVLGSMVEPFTGLKALSFPGSYGYTNPFYFTQEGPLPLTILALVAKVRS